ncbi:alginate lyase family protein [Stakelama saccharophila]|uniref:Alginate lyase family protein n=1 Tax=Stakelama saccharophila TaxID=3075605 RepID=A0ABZ0B8H1_9SPHN|nr:alginate lyase family protein [Stakelama sp. W311]WNO53720.1 alginate lyase family protein [Stakelama sp. W311]
MSGPSLPPTAAFMPHDGQAVCHGSDGYGTAGGRARTFLWRPEWLAAEKASVAADPAKAAALRRAADAALRRGPYSVTDKTKTPASGDTHDYYSIGPYWWPDKTRPGGEPYIRRDGRINPERGTEAFDLTRFQALSDDVRVLALAYHYLGDRKYADHAAKLLRVWFVDPETRMNPNYDYAQAIPGRTAGRAEGVIDASRYVPVVEGIGLIGPANVLSKHDHAAIEGWFRQFVTWMATSASGRTERNKKNNHAIYYDMLLTQFALFADMDAVARHVAADFPRRRLATQIDTEGKMPEELTRTRSWHYAHWALTAALEEATLAECVGVDLWSWRAKDGRGLADALEWLAPYQGNVADWPYKDIDIADPARAGRVAREGREPFRLAAWGYRDARWEALADKEPVAISVNDDYWLPPFEAEE